MMEENRARWGAIAVATFLTISVVYTTIKILESIYKLITIW
tara:strand:+ start:781 stop:903 length:123 start_codon:yes stop_codon:yes gene_type:complete